MRHLTRFKAVALAACLLACSQAKLHAQSPQKSPSALPTLGDGSELSAAAERRIGDRIAGSIYRDPDFLDDAVLQDYLQSIWQPLLKAAKERGDLSPELNDRFAWDVFLIRDRSVNAFALPGGYFGVHLGLIGTVGSADELAAVLSREMSFLGTPVEREITKSALSQARSRLGWQVMGCLVGDVRAGFARLQCDGRFAR